jgi:hypothetical protein
MLSQSPPCLRKYQDNLNAGLKFQQREMPRDEVLNRILEQVKLKKRLTAQ